MNICFRFDVDTPTCIQQGVPALLRIAVSMDLPFTFFFNPGRAVWHRARFDRRSAREVKPALTPYRKLGPAGWLQAALLNPQMSRLKEAKILSQAQARGHEIGLHGGRNHGHWQHDAHRWSESEIRDETRWGLYAMERLGVRDVFSFASPGWNSPDFLPEIIAAEGFQTLADRYGTGEHGQVESGGRNIAFVATALTGQPGGVGYLEASFALGWSTKMTVKHFFSRLSDLATNDVVVYDHPCFAGREGLTRLVAVIKACRSEGVAFTTVGCIGRRLLESA